jgi:adenylate cyclase
MAIIRRIQTHASVDRLEKLIAERVQPDADTNAIDERIWNLFGENWAVMFTDLSGFSRATAEFGIIHFLQIIYESQRIFTPHIDNYNGILLKQEGDSLLIIFRNPIDALNCAIAMQQACKTYNIDKAETDQVLLCLGLGYGKMLKIGDDDIFGAEVNAASKLGEDTADPWEILVTEQFKKAISRATSIKFEALDVIPPGSSAAYRALYPLDK